MVAIERKLAEILEGKKLLIPWLVCTILVTALGAIVFEVPKYYRLSTSGVAVTGRIVELQPDNHGSIIYIYQVGERSYKGGGHAGDISARFDDLRLGQEVPVFVDASQPSVSSLGDPGKHLRLLLMLTAFLASAPTLFLVALKVRRIV